MRLRCLLGRHEWGIDKNIRNKKTGGLEVLFLPFFLLMMFFGMPKVCDRTCVHCGKTKTFDLK